MPKEKVKGYISVTDQDKTLHYKSLQIKEEFKGETQDVQIRFPKELGAEHPFEFEDLEKVYKKVGFVAGTANKYADKIVGDFTLKAKNQNVQALIDSFLRDTNFNTIIRPWNITNGLVKLSEILIQKADC
jgi:hypothetical protein